MLDKFWAVIWMFFHGYEYLGMGQFVKFSSIHLDSLGFKTVNKKNIMQHRLWQ